MPPRRKSKRRYIKNRLKRFDAKAAGSRLKAFLPKAVLAALVIGCILLIYNWSGGVCRFSPSFNVSRIELIMNPFLKDALSVDFYEIPRHCNIFELDIEGISSRTQKKHPEFNSVVMSRKPPSVISVRIEYKQPVAFIKTKSQRKFFYGNQEVCYRREKGFTFVPIAADGVVLPYEVAASKALPVLSGVDFQSPVLNVGSVCQDKKLPYGIRFLITVQDLWSIKDHRISTVALSDLKNISIFLENGIEIKIGEGGLKQKLAILKDILEKSNLDLNKVKYIDLRFSDVLIGPK